MENWKIVQNSLRVIPSAACRTWAIYGWTDAKTVLPAFVFLLSAQNQNKKSQTHFACIISFNPHIMPVSRALLALFHRRGNQDFELFQDHILVHKKPEYQGSQTQNPSSQSVFPDNQTQVYHLPGPYLSGKSNQSLLWQSLGRTICLVNIQHNRSGFIQLFYFLKLWVDFSKWKNYIKQNV